MREIDRQAHRTKGRRVVFAILVFLAVVGLSACVVPWPTSGPGHPNAPPILVGVLVGVPGIGLPAIHHHGEGTPTPDEIRKFVLSHQFPGGPTTTGKPPTILGIRFITAKAANARFQSILRGRSLGLPDTATVIYVVLQGPFAISDTAILGPGVNKPVFIQGAVEVFDAATGNLLFYGP